MFRKLCPQFTFSTRVAQTHFSACLTLTMWNKRFLHAESGMICLNKNCWSSCAVHRNYFSAVDIIYSVWHTKCGQFPFILYTHIPHRIRENRVLDCELKSIESYTLLYSEILSQLRQWCELRILTIWRVI